MNFKSKIYVLLLILPLLCGFKAPLEKEDIIGLWVIDKVQCLGGKILSLGMEADISIDQMAKYQKQIEERYCTKTSYEFKEDGTFIAKREVANQDDYSWVGSWELISSTKIKLIGFSSICEDCNQFFEVIDFTHSQISLTNQFASDTENNLFSLSKAVIKFAVVLVK